MTGADRATICVLDRNDPRICVGGRRPRRDRGADRQALRDRRGHDERRLHLGRAGRPCADCQRLPACQLRAGPADAAGARRADPLGRRGAGRAVGRARSPTPSRFGETELELLTRLADLGAVALEQTRHARAPRDRERLRRRGAHRRDRPARQLHVAALAERDGARRAGRPAAGASTRRRWPRSRSPRGCTTSARSACPTRSCSRRARSTPDEWEIIEVLPALGSRDDRARSGPRQRRHDRALRARALERRRLPGGPQGRGDPARKPHHPGLRRLRRDDARPAVALGARALGRGAQAAPRRRPPVRPGGRRRADRRRCASSASRRRSPASTPPCAAAAARAPVPVRA